MSDGFGEVLGTKTNEIDTRSGNAERGEREIGTTTKHGKELIVGDTPSIVEYLTKTTLTESQVA